MPKLTGPNDAQTALRLPQHMMDSLKAAAARNRVNVSIVARWALEEWLISEGFMSPRDDLDRTA